MINGYFVSFLSHFQISDLKCYFSQRATKTAILQDFCGAEVQFTNQKLLVIPLSKKFTKVWIFD